jgi:hypothetical protein
VNARGRLGDVRGGSNRWSRAGGVLAFTFCITMVTGCAAVHLNLPFGTSATPTPRSATLDKGEQAAVKAMETSEGVQFLVHHPVVTVKPTRAFGTAAFQITLTGPYVVDPSVCALGVKYAEPVHQWLEVTYAPRALHQYDQATYRNGPDVGTATLTCHR